MGNGPRRAMWHLWELEGNVIWEPQHKRKINKDSVSEKPQPEMHFGRDGDAPMRLATENPTK